MKKFSQLVFILTFFLILPVAPISAQQMEGSEQNDSQKNTNTENVEGDQYGVATFRDQEYKQATFQNMSKLFWYFDFGDLDNNEHIDYFIRINECELFKKYYGNEFEWKPLRDTIREYLQKNRKNFSKRLYFNLPIEVGSYNLQKEYFPVLSKNFNTVERDFFPAPRLLGWMDSFCGKKLPSYMEKVYPHEIVFRLIRPMNIQHINVPKAIARQLVQEWVKSKHEKRYLYIRVYLSVTKFMGFKQFSTYVEPPIFMSYIDGYEVFSDSTMDMKVDSKSYVRRKTKKDQSQSVPSTEELDQPTEVQSKQPTEEAPSNKKKKLTPREKSLELFE